MANKKMFNITSVSREDIWNVLTDRGHKATSTLNQEIYSISDKDMEGIARGMADSYLESGVYWNSLESLAKEVLKEK